LLANSGFSLKVIDDDYHHLLTFKDVVDENGTVVKSAMDDVKALFSLFLMSIYGNAFDKRTYMPFNHSVDEVSPEEREEQRQSDINAVPVLERRHYCYARGLAFDLLYWFLNRYGFAKPMEEPDVAYPSVVVPITARLGQHMVAYKIEAEDLYVPSACTREQFQRQVEMALFTYEDMEEAYDDIEENNWDFAFDFMEYEVMPYESVQQWHKPLTDFFEFGKTRADQRYFAALEDED
jgi:hypothetical protein